MTGTDETTCPYMIVIAGHELPCLTKGPHTVHTYRRHDTGRKVRYEIVEPQQ